MAVEWVTTLLLIHLVSDSSFSLKNGLHYLFHLGFLQSFHKTARIMPQIILLPLPSTSFPTHNSRIIMHLTL
jgi:hypothetical protein